MFLWPNKQPAGNSLASSTLAVECRGVTKEFGGGNTRTLALRGVDMDVHAGEMTLLVGPSGCGKTTLISIVAGLLNPTAGEISVLGTRLDQLSGSQLVRFRAANIGFVFQQYNLLPALSAAENAAIPLLIAGEYQSAAVKKAALVLESVELGARVHALPSQLSGGQQQRVAIARALVHQPRLLVCDEPTAALDAHSGQTVLQLLRRVALDQKRAVIVVTHDNRIFQYGNRIVHLSDGCVVKDERQGVADLTTQTQVA
jgi:putative ABC transport system ATP-binding protein